jgi:molecular chaperone DnaK
MQTHNHNPNRPQGPNAVSVLGIDLGTSTLVVARLSPAGQAVPVTFSDGETICLSVVAFPDGDAPVMGREAENLILADPTCGVRHWKRHMGEDVVLFSSRSGREYRPQDLAILFLQECKKAAEAETGLVCNAATLTVPANYSDEAKSLTLEAAQKAGFEDVTLLHEPTAALTARVANTDRAVADGLRLAVDVGGGTTDVSLLEKIGNRYEIRNTCGVPKLGGCDYTQALFDYSITQFRAEGGQFDPDTDIETAGDLWTRCEEAKKRLNRADKVTIAMVNSSHRTTVTITQDQARDIWRTLNDELLRCVRQTLDEIQIEINDVVELVPIGGGSQCFAVGEELELFFGRPVSTHTDPIHAVALGAVLKCWADHGAAKIDEATILPSKRFSLRDVTAHALGVKALDASDVERFAPILLKGARMPSTTQKGFQLREEGATDALIEVFQGEEGMPVEQCTKLGDFSLEDLPPVFGRPHRLDVELRIDANGILTATAYDTESGKSAELELTYTKSNAA